MPWSVPAKEAVVTAQLILQWMLRPGSNNTVEVVKPLVLSVQSCFHDSKNCRVAWSKMWSKYIQLRSSKQFREAWKSILDNVGRQPCPIFYQYVTDKVLESLIQDYYPARLNTTPNTPDPLDYEECNALRYVAGSILCSLRKQQCRLKSRTGAYYCLVEILEDNGTLL